LENAADLLVDGAGKHVLEDVHARLRSCIGTVPLNHDLEHALRVAELTTGLVLLERYRRQEEADRFDDRMALPPPFIAAARSWLHSQLGLTTDLEAKTNGEIEAELENELDNVLATNDLTALHQELKKAEAQVWKELTEGAAAHGGGEPPREFFDLFFGDVEGQPGWSVTFQAFVREAIKDKPRVRVAFLTTRLAVLCHELAPRLDAMQAAPQPGVA